MLTATEQTEIKLRAGNFLYPAKYWTEEKGTRVCLQFPFNRTILGEVKAMQGARWHPERKIWSIANSQRNDFQMRWLQGQNPYAKYDAPLNLTDVPTSHYNAKRQEMLPLYQHQRGGVAHILQRRRCVIAGEMGTGKSLMMMIAAEMLAQELAERNAEYWYVAPKSAIAAVQRDFNIWSAKRWPDQWYTYEAFTKRMKEWKAGDKAPYMVDFDEASKLKNPTTQRTQAALALAEGIRDDWGDDGVIVLASGSPSPKSPADWWSLAEIACPGFLKEGDLNKFKRRLAIIIQKESIDGGVYPQLVSWRDNENKCDLCGQFKDHENHFTELLGINPAIHNFVASKNEVKHLYERLKGLTVVYLKKDCLDLPEKIYRVIEVKPKPSTLRAAELILKSSSTTIEGLTKLRELSDGFQYIETPTELAECTLCKGSGKFVQPKEIPGSCPNCGQSVERNNDVKRPNAPDTEGRMSSSGSLGGESVGERGDDIRDSKYEIGDFNACGNHTPRYVDETQNCPQCGGSGRTQQFSRSTKSVPCPKDDALISLLEEYEDVGRVVIYGGFTGTIDRVVDICQHQGWYTIRVDQGKIRITDPKGIVLGISDFQSMFQDQLTEYDKVAFVANPGSGGMGYTLTASPVIVYFSNTFNAEDRIQSEDRIHRPGMDLNRGATIVDLIHLPSDLKVIENLKKKIDLQKLTLGDFSAALDESRDTERLT